MKRHNGYIEFKYNYVADNGIKFKKGKIYQYSKIITKKSVRNNCAGSINTYYEIGESLIPITRATIVEKPI